MAIVLYASDIPSEGALEMVVTGWRDGQTRKVYVRNELFEDLWPGPAAQKAKPHAREMVLNAIPNKVIVEPKVKA